MVGPKKALTVRVRTTAAIPLPGLLISPNMDFIFNEDQIGARWTILQWHR